MIEACGSTLEVRPTLPSAFSKLPLQMRSARRWLVWKLVPNSKKPDKPRKVPYYVDGSLRGTTDTAEDAGRLCTFDQALARLQAGGFTGLGFALGPDGTGNHWQGIDFDGLADHPELVALIPSLPGYVERSPSGGGVHAIGYGRPFASLAPNDSGVEAYSSGRYFTVTGDAL